MVLVIGQHWSAERLFSEGDFVAYELRRALRGSVPIVPVLADGRIMPGKDEWPDDLREICFRQAQPIRSGPEHDGDLARLVNRMVELSPDTPKAETRWRASPHTIWAIGAALAVIAAFLAWPSTGQSGNDEDRPETSVAAPEIPTGSCVELDMAVSTEKADLMTGFANDYNENTRLDDGRCVEVSVSRVTSGLARQALADGWESRGTGEPEPQVWLPTSSIWVSILEKAWADDEREDQPQIVGSLAQSPAVIAMREPMARALGWPDEPIGWSDVLDLINAPGGWASHGHPEWGPLTIGKDNPQRSTSGMAATIASYYAASGKSELTLADVEDPEVRDFVEGVERGVVHYSDEALKFLTKFAEAEAQAGELPYVSAILMQEQLVYLYNTGNPGGDRDGFDNAPRPEIPLVAISPKDGTLMMDHPFVVLPSASEDQRELAAGFFEFVQNNEQQQELQAAGFRDSEGIAGTALVQATQASTDRPTVVDPPSAEVVQQILDDWAELRKKVRLLLLYDVSGSMRETVREGETTTRNDVAKKAAADALDQLSSDDEVGLWIFSSERAFGPTPYRELVETARLDDDHKLRLSANLGDIQPTPGDTALYRTIRDAVSSLESQDETDLINTVLVVSDGMNDDGDTDLIRLLDELDGDGQPPIRIFSIALDKDSDLETMREIADTTQAEAYDARDPSTIAEAFIDIISNF